MIMDVDLGTHSDFPTKTFGVSDVKSPKIFHFEMLSILKFTLHVALEVATLTQVFDPSTVSSIKIPF